jgi:hypothetical protein
MPGTLRIREGRSRIRVVGGQASAPEPEAQRRLANEGGMLEEHHAGLEGRLKQAPAEDRRNRGYSTCVTSNRQSAAGP